MRVVVSRRIRQGWFRDAARDRSRRFPDWTTGSEPYARPGDGESHARVLRTRGDDLFCGRAGTRDGVPRVRGAVRADADDRARAPIIFYFDYVSAAVVGID